MEKKENPIFLTEEECVFLSEKFEPLSLEEIQNGALKAFAVQRKKDVLCALVRCVIDQELTAEEREIANHLFINGENVLETARNCALSRSRVQTLGNAAKGKLESYLKYPFLMDFNLLNPQKLFFESLKSYGGIQ